MPRPTPRSPRRLRAARLRAARLRAALGALADLAFPTCCLGCGQRLRPDPLRPPLCAACRRRVPPADAATLALRFGKLPADAPPFALRAALWTYDEHGTVARLQHRLKYGNRPRLGDALGRWLADALPPDAAFDLVAPVPLHRRREVERGYNQSARLARGLAQARGWVLAERLLVRRRPTRSQTKLGHRARWTNVDGAFVLRNPDALREPGALEGRRVLLVDDVLTTGATLAAAARPLSEAGASVSIAALACTREYV